MKAVGLLSGGLDSTLAVKLMLKQGIKVHIFHFNIPFITNREKAVERIRNLAKFFKTPFKIEKNDKAYLKMLRYPKYGYGKNINPCIDCKIFIYKRAKKFAKKIGAKFIFTGEVLNQRPMSQHQNALNLIEKEAGLLGCILRPLSAKVLKKQFQRKKVGLKEKNCFQ